MAEKEIGSLIFLYRDVQGQPQQYRFPLREGFLSNSSSFEDFLNHAQLKVPGDILEAAAKSFEGKSLKLYDTDHSPVIDLVTLKHKIEKEEPLILTTDPDIPTSHPFEVPINFEPYYKALTEAGRDSYITQEGGVSRLTKAVAELVDNADDATDGNPARRLSRKIGIALIQTAEDKVDILVYDNGKAMSPRELEDMVVMHRSPEDKGSVCDLLHRDPKNFYCTGQPTSLYGVGAKTAIFALGDEAYIISRKNVPVPNVYHLDLSRNGFKVRDMERQISGGKRSVWKGNVMRETDFKTYMEGLYAGQLDSILSLKAIVDELASFPKLTIVLIRDCPADDLHLYEEDTARVGRQFCQEMAATYEFKLNGTRNLPAPDARQASHRSSGGPSEDRRQGGQNADFDIVVTLHTQQQGTVMDRQSLRTFKDNPVARLCRVADPGTLSRTFTLEVDTEEGEKTEVYAVLFYHPFTGEETFPLEDGKTGLRDGDIFRQVFWNGRQIHMASVGQLDYFLPSARDRSKSKEVLRRYAGMLFLGTKALAPTMDKQQMKVDLTSFMKKATITNTRNHFTTFLDRACEKDASFKLSGRLEVDPAAENAPDETRFSRVTHVAKKETFERGGHVSFRKEKKFYGTIKHVFVPGRNKSATDPVAACFARVILEPSKMYKKEDTVEVYRLSAVLDDEWEKKQAELLQEGVSRLEVEWEGKKDVQLDPRGSTKVVLGQTIKDLVVRAYNGVGEKKYKDANNNKLMVHYAFFFNGKLLEESRDPISAPNQTCPYVITIEKLPMSLGNYKLTATVQEADLAPVKLTIGFEVVSGEAKQWDFCDVPEKLAVCNGVPFSVAIVVNDALKAPCSKEELQKVLKDGMTIELDTKERDRALQLPKEYEIELSQDTQGLVTIKNLCLQGLIKEESKSPQIWFGVNALGGMRASKQRSLTIDFLPGPVKELSIRDNPDHVCNGTPFYVTVEMQDGVGNPTTIEGAPKMRVVASPAQIEGELDVVVKANETEVVFGLSPGVSGPWPEENPELGVPITLSFQLLCGAGVSDAISKSKDIIVYPSRDPVQLFLENEGAEVVVQEGVAKLEAVVGSTLEGLRVSAVDEAGRPVEGDALRLATVDWSAEKATGEGRLPPLELPRLVSEAKAYNISLQEVDISLEILLRPGPLYAWKFFCNTQGALPVQLACGQRFEDLLSFCAVDAFGNGVLTALQPRLSAGSEDAQGRTVRFKGPQPLCVDGLWTARSAFLEGPPGNYQLRVTDEGGVLCEGRLPVNLVIGPPHHLRVSAGGAPPSSSQDLARADTFYMEDLCIQAFDVAGNAAPCTASIRIELPSNVKAFNSSHSEVDLSGRLDANGRMSIPRFLLRCSEINTAVPKVDKLLTCSPGEVGSCLKPAKLRIAFTSGERVANSRVRLLPVQEQGGQPLALQARDLVPAVLLDLLRVDGSPVDVSSLDLARCISTSLVGASASTSNRLVYTAAPNETPGQLLLTPVDNERNRLSVAGSFRIKCIYSEEREAVRLLLPLAERKVEAESEELIVNSGKAVRVAVVDKPSAPIPVYVGSANAGQPKYVSELVVELRDQYGNPAVGGEASVTASIVPEDVGASSAASCLPGLSHEGSTEAVDANGRAVFSKLLLLPLAGDEVTTSCILHFSCGDLEADGVSLLVTDSARLQQQLQAVQAKLIAAEAEQTRLNEVLESARESATDCYTELTRCSEALQGISNVLSEQGETVAVDATEREARVTQLRQEVDTNAPRGPRLDPNPLEGNDDVIGQLGALATVTDDQEALMISLYLGARELNSPVSRTKETAEAFEQIRILAIPLMQRYSEKFPLPLPHGARRLPLELQDVSIKAALDVLHLADESLRSTVFYQLLSRTLLMPTRKQAMDYRAFVVERAGSYCPNILTTEDGWLVNHVAGGQENHLTYRGTQRLTISSPTVRCFGSGTRPGAQRAAEKLRVYEDLAVAVEARDAANGAAAAANAEVARVTAANGPAIERCRKEIEKLRAEAAKLTKQLKTPAQYSPRIEGRTRSKTAKRQTVVTEPQPQKRARRTRSSSGA